MTTTTQDATRTHRVFVYGTLLRGLGNHRVMTSAGGTFIAEAEVRGYRLIDTGWGFPGALPRGHQVRGEVFEVDDAGLARLDALEGVPHLYTRREVQTTAGAAWIYILAAEARDAMPVRNGDWRAHLADLSADYDPAR